MIPSQEVWNLETQHLGKHVHVYDRLDSTNTLALSLVEDSANHGVAILAREQTAGRGQYGRTWQAPPRSSVLLTVLVFPDGHLCRPVFLTAWAAVAVCKTLRTLTGCCPRIKWPNDVLVSDRKICGILIEQRATSSGHIAAAVGIGLNVKQPREWFDRLGLTEATSLACLGAKVDAETVARQLIVHLDCEFARLHERDDLEARWVEYLALLDREVTVEFHDGQLVHGRLLDLSFDGVVIRVAGEERRLAPETIKHLASRAP